MKFHIPKSYTCKTVSKTEHLDTFSFISSIKVGSAALLPAQLELFDCSGKVNKLCYSSQILFMLLTCFCMVKYDFVLYVCVYFLSLGSQAGVVKSVFLVGSVCQLKI